MGDIENNASMVLTNILGGYIHAAIITIVMLCIDWRIGLTILCGILLFTWCISRLQKKSETVSPQRQQAQETLVSNVLEYVQGMLIVKSFNLSHSSNSKMKQAILDSKDKNLKLERTFVPYNMLQQIILYGTSILVIVEGLYFLPEWNDGAFHLPADDSSILYALWSASVSRKYFRAPAVTGCFD